MLRKIFIVSLSVLYLAVTAGLVVNMHYCMGDLSSVTFSHDADHTDGACSKCGMNKTENHCCSDEVTTFKLSDAQEASGFSYSMDALSSANLPHSISLKDPLQGVSMIPSADYFSPPPKLLNKVYISIQVFRI